MKKSAFKYIVALIFLVIFSGGLSVSVFPVSSKESTWFSWQKQESENDSSRSENTKGAESKEFVADITAYSLSPIDARLLTKQQHPVDVSFTRTFYLKVPTPPPDNI